MLSLVSVLVLFSQGYDFIRLVGTQTSTGSDQFPYKSLFLITSQVTQAHSERSAYNKLLIFAYFISRQNIRVCMENATKTL